MSDQAEAEPTDLPEPGGVAIVGMSGRFPGAGDLAEFWANLRDGVESVVPLTDEELEAAGVAPEVFGQPGYVKAGPRFEGVDLFDAEFFGYTAREAQIMDPQHRLFLETAWEALENAGYDAEQYGGSVGVFGGASTTAYLENIFSNLERGAAIRGENVGLGFELAFLTSRVSYKLNLKGPSFPVQTACSSSLVALHTACQSLLNYECDMALSGAVSYKAPENHGYVCQEGSFLSPDGHVRPFDAGARGTVFGSGVGVVVLKRLEDALADGDTIRAVIKGSAVNNDGAVKASFTAPTVAGQAEVIAEALNAAGLRPGDIDYVEAHGSGTLIGDSIEVQALERVFGGVGVCGLGSLKGNVGHLDAAAGVAGLLKVVLALEGGVIPPSLNFCRGNPDVDFVGGSFRVQSVLGEWGRSVRVRRAGVSAFGFGGTNAHVVVEEAPLVEGGSSSVRGVESLVLSARSAEALERVTDRLVGFLRRGCPDLADVAFTLACGRRAFPFRRVVSGVDVEGVVGALEVRDPSRVVTGRGVSGRGSVVFLFSGQGSQYAGMVCGLYERYPVFRGAVDECVVCLDGLGVDVRGVLFGSEGEGLLGETVWAQPVLFVVEYALVRLWESWGVVPDALVGHSLGEWVAACVAGVFSLVDVLGLVVLRGRLMQECLPGSMLSVMADRVSVEAVLPVGVSLAAHNGPRDCVVSGGREGVEEFAVLAGERGWAVQWLGVSRGFHSVLMEPVVDELVAAVAAVERCVPRVPFVSNVTGRWITDEEACDPGYWGRHVRSCVEFAAGVSGVAGRPGTVFVEVGPGHVLTGLTRRVLAAGGVGAVVQASLPDRRDRGGAAEHLERALHQLWLAGVTPDWGAFYGRERRRRVPLPTYPFHRERYWLDPQPPHGGTVDSAPGPHPLLDRQLVRSMGQCVFLTEFSLDRHWVLAEHRLLGEAIVPGTTYLEMGRAAVGILLERSVTELRDVTFLVPLLVRADSPRTVHTTVKDLGRGRAEFTVASQDPLDGSWTLHVQGAASVVPLSEPVPRQDVAALLAGCALGTVDAAANQDEHKAMEFGPRWQESLRTIHVGVRSALGVLDLPERYASECHDFALHPALLDLATGFGAFAVLESAEHLRRTLGDRGFFLPVGYDSLRIHAPLPARGLSCIKPLADADGDAEVRGADVLICDESGATAVEISGFTVKRVTDARRTVDRLRPHARHHAIRWVPSPADGAPSARHRRMLVVTEANGAGKELAAALRSRGMSVVEVTLSDAWAVRGADRYRTAPTPEGFDRLIDALGDELPEEVVHVAGPTDARADSDPAEVERQLAQGVQGLFHLVRCLSVRGVVPGRFSVVARSVARVTGRESTTTAVHATLFGLAKVVGLENEDTDVLCIDMGEDTSPDRVCDELLGTRSPSAVALREGGRYVPELAPLHLTEHTRLSPAQPGEVYLVTGGLGGLGLAVARHLARTNPGVRLALVGRTGLPPREQWDKVPVADSGLRRQIAIMRELEGSGAEVRDYRGDVTDLAEMTEVVRRVRGELGPIGCVIHAAGVAGDGFLFLKDADAFRRTLAPKVLGSSVLDAVTRDDPPRLMVNFGSTVSVFGAAGQSDYTAANSYLVHFAEERTARGRETVTIEWSDWLDVGMAFDHGVRRDTGFFRSLAVEDALSSFDEVLLASCTSVIVGEVNYPRLGRGEAGGLVEMVRRGPVVLAEPIRRAMTAVTSAARAADTARAADRGDGLRLFGREDGDYSDTERALARIWADELGLTELNVRDSCFALGVDSLNALRLAQRIQKLTRFRVSMVDLYRHVTVAELAEHLDGDHS